MQGLYPNLALADEGNLHRRPTEHAFHTAVKRGVLLHPTCVFTYKPELIVPVRAATGATRAPLRRPGHARPRRLAPHASRVPSVWRVGCGATATATTRPEVLCYLQLLETTKPFLMNVLRLPALQACLLFGHTGAFCVWRLWTALGAWMCVRAPFLMRVCQQSTVSAAARCERPVDTDTATTRVIVDNWIVFSFEDGNDAGHQLAMANQFRGRWKQLVNQRLRLSARVRAGMRA